MNHNFNVNTKLILPESWSKMSEKNKWNSVDSSKDLMKPHKCAHQNRYGNCITFCNRDAILGLQLCDHHLVKKSTHMLAHRNVDKRKQNDYLQRVL